MKQTEVGTRLFFTSPERERRDTARSAIVSTLLHLLILLFAILATRQGLMVLSGDEGAGTGIGAGAAGGGGGGGRDTEVSLLIPEPPPPSPEAPQLIVPQKVEEVKPIEPPKPEEVVVAKADTVPSKPANAAPAPPTGGTGTGEGAGTGAGTGPGTGPGSGGGSGGGEGGGIGSGVGPGTGKGKVVTPSPEVLLIPPQAPGGVRGKTVVVRLAVDSVGIVKDAEIIPSTGDRKYDSALKRVALGWRFRPARDQTNRPVSVLFDVTFTF